MLTVGLHREGHVAEEAHVYSVEEASEAVLAFQRKYSMRASDCGAYHGKVYAARGNSVVYVITYKGKVMGRSAGPDKTLFNVVVFDPATIK